MIDFFLTSSEREFDNLGKEAAFGHEAKAGGRQKKRRRFTMKEIQTFFRRLLSDEEGATAVEYGVLVALIIAVCVVVIQVLGEKINNAFEKVNAALT